MRSIVLLAVVALPLAAQDFNRRGLTPEAVAGVEQLRAATKPFKVLDSAVAAGYAPKVAACLVHEHHGAMGYHHSNPKLADAKLELDHPEILLYERMPSGEYRLNGVEFIVPYAAWPRDSVAPTLIGQTLHREDNLKIWYLHVWAWSDNADGTFSNFNPSVQCGSDAKVFTPFERPPSDLDASLLLSRHGKVDAEMPTARLFSLKR